MWQERGRDGNSHRWSSNNLMPNPWRRRSILTLFLHLYLQIPNTHHPRVSFIKILNVFLVSTILATCRSYRSLLETPRSLTPHYHSEGHWGKVPRTHISHLLAKISWNLHVSKIVISRNHSRYPWEGGQVEHRAVIKWKVWNICTGESISGLPIQK
jgi:hypothetical protein